MSEYQKKGMELFRDGKNREQVALWREAKNEFPNDLTVISELMGALEVDDLKRNADEIIEYGERILEESTDNTLRSGAVQSLCFAYYYGKGEAGTAKKYAEKAGIYAVTVNQIMPRLLEGEEAVKYCQSNIQELVDLIECNTRIMLWKGNYQPGEAIIAYKFVLHCYQLLYPDGNCGFFHCRLSEIYQNMAKSYHKLGNIEEMFSCLENAAEHAIKFDILESGKYTGFMVNQLEYSPLDSFKDHIENESGLLLKFLQGETYEQFQDDERFKIIIQKLMPVAIIESQTRAN